MTANYIVERLLDADGDDPKDYAYDRLEPIPDEGWIKVTSVTDAEHFELAPVSRQAGAWSLDDAFYTVWNEVFNDDRYEHFVRGILDALERGEWQGNHMGFNWKFQRELHPELSQ